MLGAGESEVGRKPIMIEFNGEAGYVIGLEFAPRKLRLLCVNLAMESCHYATFDFDSRKIATKDDLADRLAEIIESQMARVASAPHGLLGIGIALSGHVDQDGRRIISSHSIPWQGPDLVSQLSERFDVPVVVDNRSNAAALGESLFGAAKLVSSVAYVNVEEGIGVGIVLNGKIHRGFAGYAGEVCHIPLVPGGRQCTCGKYGCWDAYLNEPSILSQLNELGIQMAPVDSDSSLQELMKEQYCTEPGVRTVTNELGYHLGLALVSIVHFINPKVIVLGGRFVHLADLLMPKIESTLKEYCDPAVFDAMVLTVPSDIELAIVRGACALPMEKVFERLGALAVRADVSVEPI